MTTEKRDLAVVIDAMVAHVPELEPALRSIRSASLYTAPEIMWMRWRDAQNALVDFIASRGDLPAEKEQIVRAIWRGERSR